MDKVSGVIHDMSFPKDGKVAVMRIGNTTLKSSRITPEVWEMLLPDRELTLYVYRHLFYRPFILGMKYADTGVKELVTATYCRNSCLQLAVMGGLGWTFGVLALGGLLSGMVGINPESVGGVFATVGFGIAMYLTVRLWLDYQAAKAD
jgi:hypothetical protein